MNRLARADVQLWVTSTGGGHRRVAEAIRSAIEERSGGRVHVAIDDPLELGAMPQARLILRGYGPLVRASPAAWGWLFRLFSFAGPEWLLERFLMTGLRAPMRRAAARRRPRAVVSCHPLLGPGAASATPKGACFMTMLTDLTVVHPGWLSPIPEVVMVPSDVAAGWCERSGMPRERIRVTGLPVDPRLARLSGDPESRAAIRSSLDLDPALPCLLVAGGAEGAGAVGPVLRAVDAFEGPLQMVALCGQNHRLLRWVESQSWRHPVRAEGYLPDPSDFLLAADAYIGKAGPSSLAEASASGLAILIASALPGQEEDNRRWAVEQGAAIAVGELGQLPEILDGLLGRGGGGLATLRARSGAWLPGGAAERVADEILRRI